MSLHTGLTRTFKGFVLRMEYWKNVVHLVILGRGQIWSPLWGCSVRVVVIYSVQLTRCLSFIKSWVWFLSLCPNGWPFQGVGFFLHRCNSPPRVGKSRSAAEKCVSSGWSLYHRPIGQRWGVPVVSRLLFLMIFMGEFHMMRY